MGLQSVCLQDVHRSLHVVFTARCPGDEMRYECRFYLRVVQLLQLEFFSSDLTIIFTFLSCGMSVKKQKDKCCLSSGSLNWFFVHQRWRLFMTETSGSGTRDLEHGEIVVATFTETYSNVGLARRLMETFTEWWTKMSILTYYMCTTCGNIFTHETCGM